MECKPGGPFVSRVQNAVGRMQVAHFVKRGVVASKRELLRPWGVCVDVIPQVSRFIGSNGTVYEGRPWNRVRLTRDLPHGRGWWPCGRGERRGYPHVSTKNEGVAH